MPADLHSSPSDEHQPNDEQVWRDLLVWLLSLVKTWIYSANVTNWRGQQCEVAEEISQETAMRTFEYIRRARRNEGPPVHHIKALCRTIAHSLFVDRIRKDRRIICFSHDESNFEAYSNMHEQADAEEIALDQLIDEETIVNAASVIAGFPDKQRAAVLRDLADVTDFAAPPSLLDQALADVGIQLREYANQRTEEPGERSRHSSLLWHAYKRLKRESEGQGD
jgi:DNA-directed RNA polymerase specialized sigma24 family protein